MYLFFFLMTGNLNKVGPFKPILAKKTSDLYTALSEVNNEMHEEKHISSCDDESL